jgi:acyl-CoA thioesterase
MDFSAVLASLAPQNSSFTADVSEDWAQGRATFGGLVAAVGNEAMRKLVPANRPLRSLQTTFVGPATPGAKWTLEVKVLRVGKAVTLTRCDIVDQGQVAATLVGVYGAARESAVQITPVAGPIERGVDVLNDVKFVSDLAPQFLQHFALRWSDGARPFSGSSKSDSKAFVRHRDAGTFTESHLVGVIDCISSPAMQMFKERAQSSSLVWTLELFEHDLAFTNEQFWRLDTQIDAGRDGYVNQTTLVIDPNGRPVALSRQLFAVFG